MSEGSLILELRDVVKRYGGPGASDGPAVLDGVCLEVQTGQSLAVVGPSGSGKSTLLNLVGGLDRPTGGRVLLDGQDLASLSDRQLAGLRAKRIGFVFQLHHLLPQCTALENVLVPVLACRASPGRSRDRPAMAEAEARARQLLQRVGLGDRADSRPGQMSGGECQRVAVVRALINGPAVLLADEPTGSLDRQGSDDLAGLLAELNRQVGLTLIVVTHSESVATRMGRVLELRDGRLREQGR